MTSGVATPPSDLHWDPYDVAIKLDPQPVWRRLRDERPVYYDQTYDFWALSRFDDVLEASLDPETYSSAYGNVLELMSPEPLNLPYLVMQDPPGQQQQRTLVSRGFTPRRIADLEDQIRQICRELLDPHVGEAGFDYVADFSAQLPSMVISALMGVAPQDQERIRAAIDRSFHIEPGVGMINDISMAASGEMVAYFREQIAMRRDEPRDDLMTALAHAQIGTGEEARSLTVDEAAIFSNEMTAAGTETVARLLGWACDLLAANPEQRAMLVEDPALIPAAVEECLRYEAPSPVQGRRAMCDTTVHGTTIPMGSRVLLLTGAAGRDERHYADADRFDLRRSESHLSFGKGIHFCLGASLARLEARVALEETLSRFPTWEVDHGNAEFLYSSTVRGYLKLPISV
jgi:cytochrome P450